MVRAGAAMSWVGRVAIVGVFVIAAAGCQALKDALPTKPTEPRPSPSQSPIAIPVVLGAPAPAATPTPSPDPAATPTPSPTAQPPTGGSCGLPASNNPNAPCVMESPLFYKDVDAALTKLTKDRPDLFTVTTQICENCYYVKDVNGYTAGVIKILNGMGYCAIWDGEELGVKDTNSFDEQYDILLSSGHMRRGTGSYRSTCRPSWF